MTTFTDLASATEWCEKMEKEAKTQQEEEDYNQLAEVWRKRESEDK